MESTDKPSQESGKTVPESESQVPAVVVMVTSKQTEFIPIPLPAKFNYSPAFIYFVVGLSVAGLYSLLSLMCSAFAISKPSASTKILFLFAILDALMAGIVASATGAAASIAYVGLKGNSHVYWLKICNIYDKFCRHIGSSVAVSLFASIILVLLVALSTYSLYRRSC
ncbi:CASP-like protein 1D1 isoform X2 [Tasmannia lanceolata]|uniref:CASP-like protein 1D1 isoform X2 n=1 Tax=Tasmannia lanceolata TaxID=3420 RepID=UPI0040629A6A